MKLIVVHQSPGYAYELQTDTEPRKLVAVIFCRDGDPLRLSEEAASRLACLFAAAALDFWQHPTVDELAAAQGVKAVSNADDLLGGWPGEMNHGFEEWISEMREPETTTG